MSPSPMTRSGVKQQMAAIIEPHTPALKHLFPSMMRSGFRFSPRLFFYCAKAYFSNGLDHFFNVCFSLFKIDHRLFFTKAHLSSLNSVEPLQGFPHSDGASPSRHAFNPQSHCLEAPDFTRVDAGSVGQHGPSAQQYRQTHNNHEFLFHTNPRRIYMAPCKMFDVSSG